MKILGLVIQNKKGTNLLIASSSSLSTRLCIIYSNTIFEHILQSYRSRLKIQRTINLDYDLVCACNISKDYILYIFSTKNDLSLAFDAIRKITDHFNRPGSTPANRIENIPKKFIQVEYLNNEYMSFLQQFLYSREIPTKQYISMLPQANSNKKIISQQILNKFSHIYHDADKKLILDSELKANMKQSSKVAEKCRIIDNAEAFQIKSQDEIYLLDIDQQKQQYINSYRRNIMKLAMGKRRPSQRIIESRSRSNSTIFIENRQDQEMIDYLDQTTMQKQKMKLKIMEKLTLHLHGQKVKQVHQLGQLLVEGTQQQTAKIILTNDKIWKNPKILSKRLSPNSLQSKMLDDMEIQFKTVPNYKSRPIVDYVMRTQVFSPQKIPLLFIYTMEVNRNNIQFTFKYKMNQKWKHKISDFDINVYLNKEFVVLDCRSIPVAHSLKNNKVTWKTKQILPNGSNSKGKILLAFGQAKFPPKKIISQIKLNMKSPCGILEGLSAECQQEWGYQTSGQKTLIIEYKISPN